MRKLIIWLSFLAPLFVHAQNRLHLTVFGGFSNYQGDLQSKRLTLDQANAAFGLGAKYDITGHWAIRGGLNYGNLEATDKKNKASLQARNLSFLSRLYEAHLLGEYTFSDMAEKNISPYLFAGVAVYHFSPYTFDSLGRKYFLQPLSTEGQGLAQYPDRKPYKLNQFAVPFGGGVKYRVANNVVLGFEIGIRKLFTDYLDDVSTTYVDPAALLAARGPKAVELSFRGGEKDGSLAYPQEGSVRGSAKVKDWYYFSGLTLAIGINTERFGFGTRGGSGRGSTSCPRW
jgi:hypothetical protein